jgi:Golgi apparatus protein 1
MMCAVLCRAVQGSARVIRCLQNQRAKLSTECRSTLRSEEISFSESIDFNYPMKQACAREMEQFCKMVPHGGGRVIRCLQVCWTVVAATGWCGLSWASW